MPQDDKNKKQKQKNMKDYYKILWVSIHANSSEIKSQFRTLVKKAHPDHNSASNAEEYFREIHEAYEVLSSEIEREKYDKKYIIFKEEEKKRKKENIKIWVKRVLTIISSFFVWFLVFFFLWKFSEMWIIEKSLSSFASGFLTYFLILILLFNFYWFFSTQKQFRIWRFHTIVWIFSFLVLFFEIFYLIPIELSPLDSGLVFSLASLFLVILLKVVFFTQESFLQIKKWNLEFLSVHFLEVVLTAVFAFIISTFLWFMLYNSIWLDFDILEIFIIWWFWWFIATLFSSFNEG